MTTPAVPVLTLNNGVHLPALGFGVFRSAPEETAAAVEAALAQGYRDPRIWPQRSIAMTTPAVPVLTLNNGVHLPALGFGVFRSAPEETTAAVEAALAQGYRLIDTAAAYLNEREVGEAIARTIVVPAVNQVELHPFFIQRDLRETHARLGIATQAWSPLGGVNVYMSKDPSTPKNPLTHSVVIALAAKYGKTPAQVVLRWHVQHGFSAIPKSVTPARIGENVDIFDFTLTPDDVAAIDALDTGVRGGPDPETIDTKLYTKTIPD